MCMVYFTVYLVLFNFLSVFYSVQHIYPAHILLVLCLSILFFGAMVHYILLIFQIPIVYFYYIETEFIFVY